MHRVRFPVLGENFIGMIEKTLSPGIEPWQIDGNSGHNNLRIVILNLAGLPPSRHRPRHGEHAHST
jgi:hypothetical protein